MKFAIYLTDAQLELISGLCHSYKDIHRGSEESIRPVMELEEYLSVHTAGKYEPDTTYDI